MRICRIIALLSALLMLLGCAAAEESAAATTRPGLTEPPLRNPQDYYEVYFEQTDGSEDMVFMLLDSMNDEADMVEEHGSVTLVHRFVDENGECTFEFCITLLKCEYGNVMYTWSDDPEMSDAYISPYVAVTVKNGEVTDVSKNIDLTNNLDDYWGSFVFPYVTPQTLNGVRQDDDGNTCYLVTNTAGGRCEYVTGENMDLKETRLYEKEDDDWILSTVINPRYDDLSLPDVVLAEIAKAAQEENT